MGHSGERTATEADLPAFAELFAAWQLRVDGRISTPAEDFVSFTWNDESFDEATGSRVFEDADGHPLAFGMLFYPPTGDESPQALVVTAPEGAALGGFAQRHDPLHRRFRAVRAGSWCGAGILARGVPLSRDPAVGRRGVADELQRGGSPQHDAAYLGECDSVTPRGASPGRSGRPRGFRCSGAGTPGVARYIGPTA